MDLGVLTVILFIIFVFCLIFRINPIDFIASFFKSWQQDSDSKDALREETIAEQSKAARAIDLLTRVFGLKEEFGYIKAELPEPQGESINQALEQLQMAAVRAQQDFERVKSLEDPRTKRLSTNKLLIQKNAYEGVTAQVEILTQKMDEYSSQFKSLAETQSQPQLPETTSADQAHERSSL